MSSTDDYRAIASRLRSWGFKVREESNCYGRNNGINWNGGIPYGHGNHHFVCGLNPDQSYIDGLVSMLVNGYGSTPPPIVNWFADVNAGIYLIATGPCNHFGTGNSSVLSRTQSDLAPTGPASSAGDMTGNAYYSGTECQHPGDSTPWPEPLLLAMVAINAAEFLQWNYTPSRAIDHYEWTNRKIDMSWMGGPDSAGNAAGKELRNRVADRMGGTGVLPPDPEEGNPLADLSQKDADLIGASVAKALMTYGAKYANKANDGTEAQKSTNVLGLLQDQDTFLSRLVQK